MKIWNCCRALFSQGAIERRDAYSVLSLYMSFLPCTDESDDIDTTVDDIERLDITTDLEFWEEIRKGLVLEHYPLAVYFYCKLRQIFVSIKATELSIFHVWSYGSDR